MDEAGQRRLQLQTRIGALRHDLAASLQLALEAALQELPAGLQQLSLGDFLALMDLAAAPAPPTARKRRIHGLDAEDVQRLTLFAADTDPTRRVTRSMAARLRKETLGAPRDSGIVPPTPRLFHGLPETPAAIRQHIRENRQEGARPIRIAGSTIRATNIRATNIRATNIRVASIGPAGNENRPQPGPAVTNLIHMELSDGKVVDLDLTKSPGSVFGSIGSEKTGEVKEWLSQYASAFTSFLKRLGA